MNAEGLRATCPGAGTALPGTSGGSPAALADRLARAGHLTSAWRDTFTRVDRAWFLPDRVWIRIRGEDSYHPVGRTAEPTRWHALSHDDQAIVTHVEDTQVKANQ
ncbi:hypothetical protein [Streptomyces sp. NPDC127033]|uniref:hypothetical protein n=1 Tax=Streptomyces sp. NPDC127033 TaxID=3347110 RepID=UPI00365E200E